MFDQLLSLLTLGTLILASYGLGRPILRGLGFKFEDALSTAVWSIAVGMIVTGIILTGMGLLGVLYVPVIGVMTLAAGFWGVGEMVRGYLRRCEQAIRRSTSNADLHPTTVAWQSAPRGLRRGMALLAIVVCIGSLVGALAPPTAGDALCYHLTLPKVFIERGAICYLPYQDNSTFPLLTEIWFMWAMVIDSPTSAALVHWGLGILLALATVLLARPVVGRQWAGIAGCVVLLVPGISNQMGAPLNDVALAAMTTLALAAWWKAAVEDEGQQWFFLAGLAGAAAVSTKYIAMIFALAVGATWLWAICRPTLREMFMYQGHEETARNRGYDWPDRRRTLILGATIVTSLTVSLGGWWYVRAAWHRGNPVYPFLSELQKSQGAADGLETLPASKARLGRSPWAMATMPWHLTMHPENFGGRGHQLGALWLAALPGLFFTRRLRGLGMLLAIAATYTAIWFLLRQNERFLFPIVPLLAVALVWVWMEVRRLPRFPRTIVIGTQAAILLACVAAACTRNSDRLAVAVGIESRGSYLSRNEPTYGPATVANALLKPGDRILSQDYRTFYFNAPVVQESVYRRITRYHEKLAAPDDLGRFLRLTGFTHLLLVENINDRGLEFDPTLSRLADADPSISHVMGTPFTDKDGGRRYYRLVALPQVFSDKIR